ncbi:MAG TPA: chaplin [Actinospica sp.]|nr:chaplin [Actinospica sp.]
MHHSTKRRVVLGMTTGGLLIGGLGMGVAQADTAASGGTADSPGILSGNLIQIPVSIPVNVCGNSVSVVGVLDSASGNTCSNAGSTGSTANGGASNSPGVGSGNLIQIPVSVPVNVCGNDVSVVGVGDSASGNHCSNGSGPGSTGGTANGGSSNSPGVGSGNTVQVPVSAPVNACGDEVSVVGILDSATGESCTNGGTPTTPGHPCGCHPTTPPKTPTPPATPPKHKHHHHVSPTSTQKPKWKASGSLAETGSGASKVAAPLGASVLGGGGLLLRKRVATLRHGTHRH